MIDDCLHAVVIPFYVHAKHFVEIGLSRVFNFSNVRNARVIDQDVNASALSDFLKEYLYLRLIRNIAFEGSRCSAGL